jgi:hypothetical protein
VTADRFYDDVFDACTDAVLASSHIQMILSEGGLTAEQERHLRSAHRALESSRKILADAVANTTPPKRKAKKPVRVSI